MRRRLKKRFHPSPTRPQDNVVANGAVATVPAAPKFDEIAELEQANVLYSFIENRYTKKVRVEISKVACGLQVTYVNMETLAVPNN